MSIIPVTADVIATEGFVDGAVDAPAEGETLGQGLTVGAVDGAADGVPVGVGVGVGVGVPSLAISCSIIFSRNPNSCEIKPLLPRFPRPLFGCLFL